MFSQDSVQFKDSSGYLYASSTNPLPVVIVTANNAVTQPKIWEWSDISTATPLPVTISNS